MQLGPFAVIIQYRRNKQYFAIQYQSENLMYTLGEVILIGKRVYLPDAVLIRQLDNLCLLVDMVASLFKNSTIRLCVLL